MKRTVVVAGLLMVSLTVGAYFYFSGRRYAIVISNAQISEELGKRFPLTKSLLVLSATFRDPKVILREGTNGVTLGIAIDVASNISARLNDEPPIEIKDPSGYCELTGIFRYEPNEFAFYLDSVTIDRLQVRGIPERYLAKVEGLSTDAISQVLRKFPVYTLRETSTKKKVAKMLLKDVTVRDGEIHILFGI